MASVEARNDLGVDPSTPLFQVVRNWLRVTGTKYACGVAKRGVGSVRGRSVMVVPTVTTLSRILPFQFPVSPTRNAAGPRRVEVWRTRVSVPTGRLFLKQVGYAVPIVDQAHLVSGPLFRC